MTLLAAVARGLPLGRFGTFDIGAAFSGRTAARRPSAALAVNPASAWRAGS
jgi:hypothetical protein